MQAKALSEYHKSKEEQPKTVISNNVQVATPTGETKVGANKYRGTPKEVSLEKVRLLDPTLIEYERG